MELPGLETYVALHRVYREPLEEIAAAVEGIVGDHCTSTLFPVMEDFAHGVDREQLTDAAMRVARRTGAKLIEMDEKIGLTKTVTATATTISAPVDAG